MDAEMSKIDILMRKRERVEKAVSEGLIEMSAAAKARVEKEKEDEEEKLIDLKARLNRKLSTAQTRRESAKKAYEEAVEKARDFAMQLLPPPSRYGSRRGGEL